MGLVLGVLEVAVPLVVEISQREKGNPSALVVADAMNEKEGRSQKARVLAWDHIH